MRLNLPIFDRDAMREDALALLGELKSKDLTGAELKDRIDDYLRWEWLAELGGRFGARRVGEVLGDLLEAHDGEIAERVLQAADKAIDRAIEWAEKRLAEDADTKARRLRVEAALSRVRSIRAKAGTPFFTMRGGVPLMGARAAGTRWDRQLRERLAANHVPKETPS